MPKQIGEIVTYSREIGYKQRLSYVASGNGAGQVEYVGYAHPGALTSEAKWQIRKFTYDSSNRVISVDFADGDDDFDNIWDNRTSLVYS